MSNTSISKYFHYSFEEIIKLQLYLYYSLLLYAFISNGNLVGIDIIPSLILSSLTHFLFQFGRRSKNCVFILRLTLFFVPLVYYNLVNQILHLEYQKYTKYSEFNQHLNCNFLWDPHLLSVDEYLLGYLFPQGQLALYLDSLFYKHGNFLKYTYTFFQYIYISFYAVGFSWMLYTIFALHFLQIERKKHLTYQWIFNSWILGFLICFVIHLVFPAVSPRIYMSQQYTYPLEGYGYYSFIENSVSQAANHTYSAFPSAHCAMTLILTIFAQRLSEISSPQKLLLYRIFIAFLYTLSVLMIFATLVLRYHYFIDFIISIVPIYASLYFNHLHNSCCFQKHLNRCIYESSC